MENKWLFEEDSWWDPAYMAIKFPASNGNIRIICAISQSALNDYFQTEDSKEKALDNFEKNKQRIYALATSLIEAGMYDEKNSLFITYKICNEHHL